MRKKVILFRVKKISDLVQRFYIIDINILREIGYEVKISSIWTDLFKFWAYDITFVYFYRRGLLDAILSRILLKKVYFTGGIDALNKDTNSMKDYKIQIILFKLCRLFATKCILVSNTDKLNIVSIFNNKTPSKLELSYHVIDIDKFIIDTNQTKSNNFVSIVWMGQIENVLRKGIDKSLLIFNYLKKHKEFSNSKFLIIGQKGNGTLYIENLIQKLGLIDSVKILGEISEEEKIKILKLNKYYFQMSTYEGFGLSALEALAAGDIVIHTGKGGLKDTIKNFGVIVEPDNIATDNLNNLFDNIMSFDYDLLSESLYYVKQNFSYEKRKADFKKIII
jgi:glycosyltransferase involved in cell wall biosynthesis